MISSAVVIPEPPPSFPSEQTPSPSFKRRQSSFESDTNKRPRLDSTHTNGNGAHHSPPPVAASPPRRKSSAVTGVEEKKRGQRLFGGLLGTLSQTSTKRNPSQQKREDIEKRQLERIKRENEEREEERRRKKEQLAETRREEQKRWQAESRKIRRSNMRATAEFLRTEAEPRLYYRPWELRQGEKDKIEKQKNEVEKEISREMEEAGEIAPLKSHASVQENENKREETGKSDEADVKQKSDQARPDVPAEVIDQPDEEETNAEEVKEPPPPEEKGKEDEHHGEELVQGQEDDVIY